MRKFESNRQKIEQPYVSNIPSKLILTLSLLCLISYELVSHENFKSMRDQIQFYKILQMERTIHGVHYLKTGINYLRTVCRYPLARLLSHTNLYI